MADLLSRLNRNQVDFILVGGFAVKQYVPVRQPHDIDIWIRPDINNVLKAASAILETDSPGHLLRFLDQIEEKGVVQLWNASVGINIDVLATVSGAELIGHYPGAKASCRVKEFDGEPASYPSLHHLRVNKAASLRNGGQSREKDEKDHTDLVDAERWQELKGRKRERDGPPEPDPPDDPPPVRRNPDGSKDNVVRLDDWRDQSLPPLPDLDGWDYLLDRAGAEDAYYVEAAMLSIRACGGGAADYYLSESAQEYDLRESEPSAWLGRGADRLGLCGRVEADEFRPLFDGYNLDGSKLVQNAGKADRAPGWDLTFSAPKGVSILWATSGPEDRARIEAAHLEAVKSGVDYLEREAAVSRREHAGVGRDPASLVVAAFHHGTSRALDPQLHTHCVVLNAAVRPDGSTGAILSQPLFDAKMAAGAAYQAKLSAELERMGVRTEPVLTADGLPKGYFEVSGVPKAVRDAFSTRRQEVEAALEAKGVDTPAAAGFAALATRAERQILPPGEELFNGWKVRAEGMGFSVAAAGLFGRVEPTDQLAVTAAGLAAAKQTLSSSVSHFTERELFRETLIRTVGNGASPEFVRQHVRRELETSKEFVALGQSRGEWRFTTLETWAAETQLLGSTRALHGQTAPAVRESWVGSALEGVGLKGGEATKQAEAVRYLTREGSAVRVLSGAAGTEMAHTIDATRTAYRQAGFRVIDWVAAMPRGPGDGPGVTSDTAVMRLLDTAWSLGDSLKHHATQLTRTALGLPAETPDPKSTIDKTTVVLVELAELLGTKDLARLTREVEAGGGRLILAGDHRALPAGGPAGFRTLFEGFGGRELNKTTGPALGERASPEVEGPLQTAPPRGPKRAGREPQKATESPPTPDLTRADRERAL